MVVVYFGQICCTEVNYSIRVVSSLLNLDTWKPMYGIGRIPAQTTYCCVPPEIPPVSCISFCIENTLKTLKTLLIGLKIICNNINKPLSGPVHRIGA